MTSRRGTTFLILILILLASANLYFYLYPTNLDGTLILHTIDCSSNSVTLQNLNNAALQNTNNVALQNTNNAGLHDNIINVTPQDDPNNDNSDMETLIANSNNESSQEKSNNETSQDKSNKEETPQDKSNDETSQDKSKESTLPHNTNNMSLHHSYSKELEWELAMSKLDWSVVEDSIKNKKGVLPVEWVEKYYHATLPFLELVRAPLINTTRSPIVIDCNRKEYSHFLTGKRRSNPVKVYDLTEMAYELDILEIRLFELESVVDEFALLEGTYTHVGIKKPLFYQRNIDRYTRWADKIKYLVWDDRMSLESDRLNGKLKEKYDWSLEKKSRYYLLDAFIELHNNGDDFDDNDLFILGDLDEVPSSEVIAHLKYCEMKDQFLPAKFSAIFWRFSFHWLFPESVEYPIIANWKLLNTPNPPLRENLKNSFGKQAWHLNRFGPAVMQVIKEFSIAEGGLVIPLPDVAILRDLEFIESRMANGIRPCCPNDHLKYVDPIEQGYPIPWIVLANQESKRWEFL